MPTTETSELLMDVGYIEGVLANWCAIKATPEAIPVDALPVAVIDVNVFALVVSHCSFVTSGVGILGRFRKGTADTTEPFKLNLESGEEWK